MLMHPALPPLTVLFFTFSQLPTWLVSTLSTGAIRSLENGTIYQKTLCMTALQNASIHYNVHSLYGHTEARGTMK